MPRQTASKKPAARKKPRARVSVSTSSKQTPPSDYQIALWTRGTTAVRFKTTDKALYPIAVSWNRLLNADRERMSEAEWRKAAHKAILDLVDEAEIGEQRAIAFLTAAANASVIQVEIPWISESVGYAARVFPWEAMLALATKDLREPIGKDMAVVRYLRKGTGRSAAVMNASGPPVFVVSSQAEKLGYDITSEHRVISDALESGMKMIKSRSIQQLGEILGVEQPRIVHCVFATEETDGQELHQPTVRGGERPDHFNSESIARAVAAHLPALAVFSSCHSGRRLAPLAVAAGACMAVGFHDYVVDSSIPAFFGAFYEAWQKNASILECLQNGLRANGYQPRPRDLGVVTLWTDYDLLAATSIVAVPAAVQTAQPIPAADAAKAVVVTCKPVTALNYAMLQNKRGGIFTDFQVFKSKPGAMPPLEVTITLDTGLDLPARSHFFVPMPEEGARPVPLMDLVAMPLGAKILRQRGETMMGTLEVSVECQKNPVSHHFVSIQVPPCDEWLDNAEGRRYLPCFVFPRDPAVRDIITAAQPFLRAVADHPTAGFDGYQGSFAADLAVASRQQVRAIWAALQLTLRLDYVEPPPSYSDAQRLRIPEEIQRARRGTCIELALLLAACLEHIGIHAVIFLTKGHSFTGYWATDTARDEFQKIPNLLQFAQPQEAGNADAFGGGQTPNVEPWFLTAQQHLAAIREQVRKGCLIPLEATYLALQQPFQSAIEEAAAIIDQLNSTSKDFDGMLDIKTAREKGLTPLAILVQGIVA